MLQASERLPGLTKLANALAAELHVLTDLVMHTLIIIQVHALRGAVEDTQRRTHRIRRGLAAHSLSSSPSQQLSTARTGHSKKTPCS